jgi:hypothetical protein
VPSPPPQHMVTRANSWSVRSSSWSALVVRTAPVPPRGWPRATAPPLGLTVAGSALSSSCHASTTDAKASLISVTAMSLIDRPVRSSRRWVAGIGPVSMRTGSEPTRQVSSTFARARSPRASAFSLVMRSTAAAPSEICDAEPAVWRPPSAPTIGSPGGTTGLRPASPSRVVSRRPSSLATVWVVPVGLPSSPRSGASIGTIWVSKRPSAHAWAARSCDCLPKASSASRLMPHFWAMSSAPWNCEVHWYREKYDLGTALPTPWLRLEPMGTWLITSTPQATATSTTPDATSEVAKLVACWEDPHWLSTVVAAAEMGRPASSQAVRATLKACMPTWLTQPPTTCSTSLGSMPERSISSFCTAASRFAECMVERPPLRRPMGERTASTITTSRMPTTLAAGASGDTGVRSEGGQAAVRSAPSRPVRWSASASARRASATPARPMARVSSSMRQEGSSTSRSLSCRSM